MDYAEKLGTTLERVCMDAAPTAYGIGVARGAADERERCVKFLEDLRNACEDNDGDYWLNKAIAVLS